MLARISEGGQHGFSLLELLLVVVILTIVIAVVVSGVIELQKTNTSQAVNVDLTQQSRQFMDQVVQDLHQAGFPPQGSFDPATQATMVGGCLPASLPSNCYGYATGLVSVHTNSIQYEGDVDGTGVSEVFVQLAPSGGPCPCTLRRGAVSKALYAGGTLPTYYTEVDGVMNLNVFTAYDFAGNSIPLPCDVAAACAAITNIKNIGLLLQVQSQTPNPTNHTYTNVTMSTEAKVH